MSSQSIDLMSSQSFDGIDDGLPGWAATKHQPDRAAIEAIAAYGGRKVPRSVLDGVILDPATALCYATNFLKGRFPRGEPIISSTAYTAFRYATKIIRGRWRLGEPAIALRPEVAILYATTMIPGRWELVESDLAAHASTAYRYAVHINSRFLAGEWAIRQNPYYAAAYAINILQARWLEAESTIRRSGMASGHYTRFFFPDVHNGVTRK